MFLRSLVASGLFAFCFIMTATSNDGPVSAAEPPTTKCPLPTEREKPQANGESVPRELAMRPLPDYRIEPPDVLQIDMPKLVPRPPYRAAVFDVLQVHVLGAPPDRPIDNYYLIEAEGTINLGPAYGSVRVAGMTLDEAKHAVEKKVHEKIPKPEASVQVARVAAAQTVGGQYLVGPDGTINLRSYGRVSMSGKTVAEARIALQKHLSRFLDSPELSVDVASYNSKVYYVITQGAGMGDSVRRFPVTGNETVLDAIAQMNGLSQLSSKKIWIARPSAARSEQGTILPVDWDAITQRGATASNYQIMPGDRLYIAEDELVALNARIGKVTAPLERVLGVVGLLRSTLGTP